MVQGQCAHPGDMSDFLLTVDLDRLTVLSSGRGTWTFHKLGYLRGDQTKVHSQ
jgi:hypothetical protein